MARHSPIVATETVTKLPPGDPNDLHKMTPRTCEQCGDRFMGKGRARFCSDACKQSAWRSRRATKARRRK